MRSRFLLLVILIFAVTLGLNGCALNFYKQNPRSKEKINELKSKITDLESQKQKEQEEFAAMKRELEKKLKSQIADNDVSLTMSNGALAIILSDDILFDSGKAEIKNDVFPVLDKVASTVLENAPGKDIGISGHTDNVPITHSGWKSNWELSTARATNVLHYLVKKGISPSNLSATGYGEYKPIASNDTIAGRKKNRRVEILILPKFTEKKNKAENEAEYIK